MVLTEGGTDLDDEFDKMRNDTISTVKTQDGQLPEYLFVAYTSKQFNHKSVDDMKALHDIAKAATRHAGLDAYWLGSSCMNETDNAEDQLYWISDIVRSAALTCMAIGPSDPTRRTQDADMMKEWGSRIWTFPEILLSRAHLPILKVRRGDLDNIEELPLTQFPAKVWNDGDYSYVLMGLVNIRPRPIWADSAFQAFARLSLANNSEKLLERLICVLPRRADQEWWDMSDAFSVNLWDIYPSVQIAGICGAEEMHKPGRERDKFPDHAEGCYVDYHDDDAVIIDGRQASYWSVGLRQ
ncbi:hypothetical protein SLS54_009388 [Diplodia seriata]